MASLLNRCEKWFEATGASIFLRDADGVLRLVAKAGSDAEIPDDATISEGEGIAGTSVQSGQPMLIGDPKSHPLLSSAKVSRRANLGSALVVPLNAGPAICLGVLNLSRRFGAAPFTMEELRLAQALAGVVGLAVSNAKLFAETLDANVKASGAHARLESVLKCLGVAVVVVDAEGCLVSQNPAADRLLGGSRFADAPVALKSAVEEAVVRGLQGSDARTRARDDSTDRAWSVIASPIPGGGATVVAEEVTEEEREIAERARINRLAEIGQLTATIAHEIRNPLTGIRSAAQMIGEVPEKSATFGKIIEEEAVKLNALCDEFLEFARPLALRIGPVELSALAQRVTASHSSQFGKAGVELRIDFGSRPTVIGDDLRLEQVMRNLLVNALQASDRGGVVQLELMPWGFAVEDHGCGMEPEVVKRLFTPFFTTKAKGTGLGLSTVRKIVEAHGGRLNVDSRIGLGTRFEVILNDGREERQRLSA